MVKNSLLRAHSRTGSQQKVRLAGIAKYIVTTRSEETTG
jgi:hypothetical protein